MKRVLMITALLGFFANGALADDWDYYGTELLPAQPDLTITSLQPEDEEDMAEPMAVEELPLAEDMAAPMVPSRVVDSYGYGCPSCCDGVWAGYCPPQNCCGSAWDNYRRNLRGWCDDARCKISSLRPQWGGDCCDCGEPTICCEPAPVACESCCDPCAGSCGRKRLSWDRFCDRVSDCCPDFDFCSSCDDCGYTASYGGCDCQPECDCCDPCADSGRGWFSGKFLSGLFHKHDDCCCESGMWQEGDVIYEYDYDYQDQEMESVQPLPGPVPASEDHSARRLRLPSVSLPSWMQF